MPGSVVVVESPSKAKTIEKYLGQGFTVLASYGHVRDLVPKTGAVDPNNDFAMRYEPVEKNAKHVQAIKKALSTADTLILATDPDREGEAIAWSVYELMKAARAIGKKPVQRVVFHEITRNAIKEAMTHPRELDMDLIDAQQARRALDYLVGFNLSPLLWRKVARGLSAGRVQSPALRLIVEREEAIEQFISQEYWSITAQAKTATQGFQARLLDYQGKKFEQFTATDATAAESIKQNLLQAANGELLVSKVEKKQRKRHPAAPFITSTLQQEASRKLGFGASRTMRIAQQLYEGIDVGNGAVGLITYMRTDSVNLSQDALHEIRAYIQKRYGDDYLPEQINTYKTKAKNAQEAHEAIRPTDVNLAPQQVKSSLSPDQFKLYQLIWQRTVACQMIHATLDTVAADLKAGDTGTFRANGSVITHPGFISVYQEGLDDGKVDDDAESILPPLTEGEKVKLTDILAEQHFTEPPPRYTEATLVKALEEFGIGRPSTYASIIYTLQQRQYATLDKKRFFPTDIARIVNKFLTQYFTQYVDYDFTAKLEDELDAVARGEKQWVPLLSEFWQPFTQQITTISETVSRKDVTQEEMDEACPECGKPLSIRLGRTGRFVGCTAYPECKYTRSLDNADGSAEPEEALDRDCPKCQSKLLYRRGRYGKFIGCSNYPTCNYIESLNKPTDTGISCPTCHQGTMLERKSRYGKMFYSCSRYPDCQYATWNPPIVKPCPQCHWPIVTIKTTKRKGTELVCPQKTCGYAEPFEDPNAT